MTETSFWMTLAIILGITVLVEIFLNRPPPPPPEVSS